ncbi:hypothetical protein [Fredinandcohnia quinoae]|uniref:Holin n=1 Tax=Fredinandcohnia quinoae TaxID=2918902 RepID=A0AAW5E9H9_9BACI|nr:hypothetical protein [Fredinandcohnia sp. SECRCQ15]MCH1627649.1 hypothetical protein [Fredinandcohnia sp. SECRCQ15]
MKWKNYGLWISIASILYMVLKDLGFKIDLTEWQTYVTAILGVLATLGIISNPEKGKGFFDRIPIVNEMVTQISDHIQSATEEQENSPIINNEPSQNKQIIATDATINDDSSQPTSVTVNVPKPHGMPAPPNEYM